MVKIAVLSYYEEWGGSPLLTFDFSYEKKREGATQYYKVTASCDPCTGSSYFGYPIYLELKLDGVSKVTYTLKAANPSQWSSAITYTSGWLAIQNKTSGTASLDIRVYSGLGSSRNKTYSYTLPIDPAASKISATDAQIGKTSAISITKYDSNFTTTVSYKAAGQSKFTSIWTKQAHTSYGWTVPTSLYSLIPDVREIEVTLQCQTYSGSTLIGTETCTMTATTSESTSKPSVEVSAVDSNENVVAITGSNKIIVKGFSDVKVSTTATANNSASIKKATAYCGSTTKTGTSVTFTGAESATIKAKATDSRDYSNEATASGLTLVDYIIPTIVEDIQRASPTSDTVNISVRGKWYNGNIGKTKNTLVVQVRYKPKSQESYADADKYVDMNVTVDGDTYTATATLTGLEYTQAYSIRIRVSDALHEYNGPVAEAIYRNTELSKGIPVFDWGEDDFQFNVPVKISEGSLTIGGTTLTETQLVNLLALLK